MTKVLESEVEDLARQAALEVLRDAVRARVRERAGARLEEIGRAVADRAMDDFEANLEIEALIAAHQKARRAADARVVEAIAAMRGDDKGGEGSST
jgi:hypothetical protein